MSRLLKKMKDFVAVNGMAGKADLCKATNRGMRSIEQYMSGRIVPPTQVKYRLALACGCTEKEALKIANEPSSEARRAG